MVHLIPRLCPTTESPILLLFSDYNLITIHNPLQLNTAARTNFASHYKTTLTLTHFYKSIKPIKVSYMLAQNLDKIGPKK